MSTLTLLPGAVPLASWRAILHGAGAMLDPTCQPAIQRAADAVNSILVHGAPI